MKLIDKDKVIAELNRLANIYEYITPQNFRDYINSLEVKDVDLEKESLKWVEEHQGPDGVFSCIDFAKHFYELGFNVHKEE